MLGGRINNPAQKIGGFMVKKILWAIIALHVCSVVAIEKNFTLKIVNTSPSTIYITNSEDVADESQIEDLEKAGSIALAPRESDTVQLGRNFAIFTRLPKGNYKYQRHLTVAFKEELEDDEELEVDIEDLERNRIEGMPLLVINHARSYEIPEAAYALCPDGTKPVKGKDSDMYFCTLPKFDKKINEYIDTKVPVIHYVYEYLPSWVWSSWYTKNPALYAWYDNHADCKSRLCGYKTPWSTRWYAQWYKTQPPKITEHLQKPH